MFAKKIQVVQFEQNPYHINIYDNKILFVRIKDEITDKNAQIEVPPTHVAFVIKSGSEGVLLKSGKHPVFENKEELKNFKKGFSVDVVYMPINTEVKIKWGTGETEKMTYRDEISNKVITIGASGEFVIHIENYEQFYKKVVGVKKVYEANEFKTQFAGVVLNEFTDCFLHVICKEKITYDRFQLEKKAIGIKVNEILKDKFISTWGIGLSEFIISSIVIDDKDKEAVENETAEARRIQKIKEYLAEIERLDDKQWEREKYLKELELSDRQAYYEVLKVIGHPSSAKSNGELTPSVANVYCPNCGTTLKNGDVFCPKCGTRVIKEKVKCPYCGHENDSDTTFCPKCGNKIKK